MVFIYDAIVYAKFLFKICCNNCYFGFVYFSNGEELIVEEYNGRRQIYHCGHQYKKIEIKNISPTLLVVVDAREATIGETDGENINILWSDTSMVPNKHHMGGQSQMRFQRDRERALQSWLRSVLEQVKQLHNGRDIIIGGPGMTKDKFIKEFPT